MWSTTYPGHRPFVFPVLGQGCSLTNAARCPGSRSVLAKHWKEAMRATRTNGMTRRMVRIPVTLRFLGAGLGTKGDLLELRNRDHMLIVSSRKTRLGLHSFEGAKVEFL